MSEFEKFFARHNVMVGSFILALVFTAVAVLMTGFGNLQVAVSEIIVLVLIIALYCAFRSHEKNMMNTLIGAVLAIYLITYVNSVYASSVMIATVNELTADIVPTLVISLIEAVLFVILFVNHISVNCAHHSTKKRILFNQVIIVILIGYQIFSFVALTVIGAVNGQPATIVTAVPAIGKIFLFCMIVCIESKLNVYKVVREVSTEEGTWTEEKKEDVKNSIFGE